MQEGSVERKAWDDYRKRRAILLWLLIGFLPVVGVAGMLSQAFMQSDQFAVPFALCWMIAYGMASLRFGHFPCPRCGRPFFIYRLGYVPWTRTCLHCSWSKWQEYDAARDPPPAPENGGEVQQESCLNCGADMPAEMDRCLACGWSYLDATAETDQRARS